MSTRLKNQRWMRRKPSTYWRPDKCYFMAILIGKADLWHSKRLPAIKADSDRPAPRMIKSETRRDRKQCVVFGTSGRFI